MKKIIFSLFGLLMLQAVLFAQRAFQAPFGDMVGKDGNWTIYEDDFEGLKVAIPKNIGNTFVTKGILVNDLSIYFYFVSSEEENSVTIWLRLGFSEPGADSSLNVEKIIFMDGNKNKLTLIPSPQVRREFTEIDPGNPFMSNSVITKLAVTKDQFLSLCEMLQKKDVICAVYSNGGGTKLKQYSKRMNTVAKDALEYFVTHYSSFVTTAETNIILK